MRVAFAVLLALAASACVEVVDATPKGIWLKEPFISFGDPDAVAAEHCAKYGRRAVKAGQLGPGEYYLPIEAYDCH